MRFEVGSAFGALLGGAVLGGFRTYTAGPEWENAAEEGGVGLPIPFASGIQTGTGRCIWVQRPPVEINGKREGAWISSWVLDVLGSPSAPSVCAHFSTLFSRLPAQPQRRLQLGG